MHTAAMTPDGRRALVGTLSVAESNLKRAGAKQAGILRFWDLTTGREFLPKKQPYDGDIFAVAISRDGLIPKSFQQVNPRTHAPVVNTAIVCVVVGLVSGFVDATFLWDMVSMGTLTAFMVVSLAVPVMRKKENGKGVKGFRVPFGPYVVPGLSIAACLYLVFGLSMTTYTIFGIWMLATVLTYFLYGMRHSRLNATTN